MLENESEIHANKSKPKTTTKEILQYSFSTLSPGKCVALEKEQSLKSVEVSDKKKKNKQKRCNSVSGDQRYQPQLSRSRHCASGETQFEDHLVDDLDELLKKWDKKIFIIELDLENYQHVVQTQSQKKAFEECINLLQAEFAKQQMCHEESTNIMVKKILQVDDYKKRLIKEIKEIKCFNEQLTKQYEVLQEEHKKKMKEQFTKRNVIDKINQEKAKMEKFQKSLQQCKQKSYQQRNSFIQIQSQQFRIERELSQLEDEAKKQEEGSTLRQKYEQLLKIKQKVIISRDNTEQQIRPHLQRKIQKMSKLRSELKNIDDVLQVCKVKIEDQNIVVDALKEKSYHEETNQNEKKNDELYQIYKKRYSEIYFGKYSTPNSDWKTYNVYLKQLINRNRRNHSRNYTQLLKDQFRSEQVSMLVNSKVEQFPKEKNKLKTLPLYDSDDIFLDESKHIQREQTKNKSTDKSQNQRVSQKKDSTKLPRIIKIEGKINESDIKKRVKEEIIRENTESLLQNKDDRKSLHLASHVCSTNIEKNARIKTNSKNESYKKQSDFQLQSINSRNSKVSGDIIEVEFHKK